MSSAQKVLADMMSRGFFFGQCATLVWSRVAGCVSLNMQPELNSAIDRVDRSQHMPTSFVVIPSSPSAVFQSAFRTLAI